MKKPNNYEETQVQGEFTPVELGGHKLVIKQVEERMSRTNKPMIVVFFDFAPGDKQAGYFAEAFKNDIRPEKKWPNQATQYILTEDNEGNCSRSFKTFLTCVEHSNQGFTTQWGDNFGKRETSDSIMDERGRKHGCSVIVGHPGTGRKSFSGKRSGISQSGICTGSS